MLTHKWISSSQNRYRSLSKAIVNSAFNNMRCFVIGFELQRAALLHMAKTSINKQEKGNLKMIFDALDEEKDGEIELSEFVE